MSDTALMKDRYVGNISVSENPRFLCRGFCDTSDKRTSRSKIVLLLTVTTVHAGTQASVFECRMRKSGNRSQRFASNIPIFQKNVRANLANFIQDLFWGVSFSNEDFKTVEEGLGDRQDFNLGVPWSTRHASQSVGCEEGSKKLCFYFKYKRIKGKRQDQIHFFRDNGFT